MDISNLHTDNSVQIIVIFIKTMRFQNSMIVNRTIGLLNFACRNVFTQRLIQKHLMDRTMIPVKRIGSRTMRDIPSLIIMADSLNIIAVIRASFLGRLIIQAISLLAFKIICVTVKTGQIK